MSRDQALSVVAGLRLAHRLEGREVAGPAQRALIDPAVAKEFAAVPDGGAAEVDQAVTAAQRALSGPWRRLRPAERGRLLMEVSRRLLAAQDRFALAETLNMGKPLRQSRGDVGTAARFFEYYAGIADKLEGETIPLGLGLMAWTELEPVGVTAQIVPWNAPLAMLARGLAPALAAGCSVVVKPAETTPLTALLLADLLSEAGLPAGVVNVVLGPGQTGAALAAHPAVAHVTFTGSVASGKSVMASAATHLASVTLELGGKSPVVVLQDADLEAAAEGVVRGIITNAGQICAAGSRLIVETAVAGDLLRRVGQGLAGLRMADGFSDPDLGPLASKLQHERVAAAIDRALASGDRLVFDGQPPEGPGYFRAPMVLATEAQSALAQEEVFGPVLAVLEVSGPDEALAVANASPYGLVAGIYSRNIDRALAFARRVEAGQVFINRFLAGGVETPVGGVKQSGFGREKGLRGLEAYLRAKCTTVTFVEP